MTITKQSRRLICFLLLIGQVICSQSLKSNLMQIDALENETIRLPCKFNLLKNELIDQQESPVYYWMRKNETHTDNVSIKQSVLDKGYKLDINLQEGKYDLIINAATYYRDNAKFECYAKTTIGDSIKEVFYQLTILIPPGPAIITPSNPTFIEGEQGELVCQSSGGSPPPDIQWFRNGTYSSF